MLDFDCDRCGRNHATVNGRCWDGRDPTNYELAKAEAEDLPDIQETVVTRGGMNPGVAFVIASTVFALVLLLLWRTG